jgi:Ca2+-binding RTX toxin-like protein
VRRTLLLLSTMMLALLLACGVALAANITCQGGSCVGTEENDRITGSLLDDQIQALGGRDHVQARPGDDEVYGDAGGDDITGGVGGDYLVGGRGPDEIGGGPGTPEGDPIFGFACTVGLAYIAGEQHLWGGDPDFSRRADGNDILAAGRDNDFLMGGGGRNDFSGNGGDDCLYLNGEENERVSGGDGDDIVHTTDLNADDIFCGAGNDTVAADAEDRVAADCEVVLRNSPVQTVGATPEAEVTITTPDGSITMTP